MPTYALLGADLYLPTPPPVHTWGGGGGDQKAQEKLASRSSLFLQRCRVATGSQPEVSILKIIICWLSKQGRHFHLCSASDEIVSLYAQRAIKLLNCFHICNSCHPEPCGLTDICSTRCEMIKARVNLWSSHFNRHSYPFVGIRTISNALWTALVE
jgi:hypothetical protein